MFELDPINFDFARGLVFGVGTTLFVVVVAWILLFTKKNFHDDS